MKNNEAHRQNNENTMKNNGSTHDQLKNVTICRKNAISSSADPRTPRLLTSDMYVHGCNCTYIQRIYVCTRPFSEVTILFNQHFIIVENTVGKSPTGILTLFI